MLARCARIWCVRPVPMRTSKIREFLESPQHAVIRQRVAAMIEARRHARPMRRIARNRLGDAPGLRVHAALHQRQVRFLRGAIGELAGQRAMRRIVARDEQHAAGSPVQSMHNARPQFARPPAIASRSDAPAGSPAFRNARPRPHAPPVPPACSPRSPRRLHTESRSARLPARPSAEADPPGSPQFARLRAAVVDGLDCAPFTVTRPSLIQDCKRARLYPLI